MSLNDPRSADPALTDTGPDILGMPDVVIDDHGRPAPPPSRPGPDLGRAAAGMCFIAFGVALWLSVRGAIDFIDLATFWPLGLVALGGSCLLSQDRETNRGWFLIAIGIALQLLSLGLAPWPIILVVLGVVLLFRGLREGRNLLSEER